MDFNEAAKKMYIGFKMTRYISVQMYLSVVTGGTNFKFQLLINYIISYIYDIIEGCTQNANQVMLIVL